MGFEARREAAGDYMSEVANELLRDGELDEEIREMILEGIFDEEVRKRFKMLQKEKKK